MRRPPSIHDPITPEQAYHLPCFYWNVRKKPSPADAAAERKRAREIAKYQRNKAARAAQRDAWAAAKLAELVNSTSKGAAAL